MADVSIKFKGSTIAEMSESGTKTLETGGTYCEDDITVVYSGGSGGTDVYEAINRTTNVNVSDTNLSTVMARGIYAGTAAMAQGDTLTAGTIYIQYE